MVRGLYSPMGAAGNDCDIGIWKFPLQAGADALHDKGSVAHRVAEFVDPIDENRYAVFVESSKNPQQGDIGRRQRLTGSEHNDVDVRGFESSPRDFIADEERIVRTGGVDDGGWKAEIVAVKVEISRLYDIRIETCLLGARDRETATAGADISFQYLRRDRRKRVLPPK